jgi:LmbE family N-acetylglucosaminyl deacetylase
LAQAISITRPMVAITTQDIIEDAVDRGVRADADGERQHDDHRACRGAAERANGEAQITAQRIEESDRVHATTLISANVMSLVTQL